ncbi:Sodium/calcium exchanger membrane region [Penicillium roqueforti FM164]|uniref:Sodium/calcium exchanger membrane region n=2 Tax=Penicillium roqueforti TaxID=5082 RepID=W6PRV2_PENRF|nr:Sodium/calcium exchanger membrane region [Penicillium roqueforti FM164]
MGSIRSTHSQNADPRLRGNSEQPKTVQEKGSQNSILPTNSTTSKRAWALFRVDTAGESGRSGIQPWHLLKVCFRSVCTLSMVVNILWPFVPAAIVIHFARPDLHVWIFSLNYIAMVPSANLLGFAGGELAKKLPKMIGIIVETTLGAVVELVLFMVLLYNHGRTENSDLIPVIQAAILGSIMANLLLCLGMCFFVGGIKRHEQTFHEAISEVGTGLLLVAGFGLLIPSAFYSTLRGSVNAQFTLVQLNEYALTISRATAVILLVAFLT